TSACWPAPPAPANPPPHPPDERAAGVGTPPQGAGVSRRDRVPAPGKQSDPVAQGEDRHGVVLCCCLTRSPVPVGLFRPGDWPPRIGGGGPDEICSTAGRRPTSGSRSYRSSS